MSGDKHFDFDLPVEEAHAFVQWKGTNVCMDFWCDCGAQMHFDGDFAYEVSCPHCHAAWQMPFNLFPRRIVATRAKMMEPDEDHSDEYVDAEGITRFRPHPLVPGKWGRD